MHSGSFTQSLQEHGVELPPRAIERGRYTRWGKGNRYWAKRLDTGVLWGDHKQNSKVWVREESRGWAEMTSAERDDYRRKQQQHAEQERQVRFQQGLEAQMEAIKLLEESSQAQFKHPYIRNKRMMHYYFRQRGDELLIPFSTPYGVVTTLQRVQPNGRKFYLRGGVKRGSSFALGNYMDMEPVIFCEGAATASTIHMATGWHVITVGDTSNYLPAIFAFLQKHPNARFLVIAADNDSSNFVNTGVQAANYAAATVNAIVAYPTFTDEQVEKFQIKHGKQPTDFNDLQECEGHKHVAGIIESAVEQKWGRFW